METRKSYRVLLGILNLPAAGLIFTIALLLRGPFIDPTADPMGFARSVTASSFVPVWLAIMAGMVLEIPGCVALYLYLQRMPELAKPRTGRLAFVGMALSAVGISMALPLAG